MKAFFSVCFLISALHGYIDCQDIIGCGGFVKSEVPINFSVVEVYMIVSNKKKLIFETNQSLNCYQSMTMIFINHNGNHDSDSNSKLAGLQTEYHANVRF